MHGVIQLRELEFHYRQKNKVSPVFWLYISSDYYTFRPFFKINSDSDGRGRLMTAATLLTDLKRC